MCILSLTILTITPHSLQRKHKIPSFTMMRWYTNSSSFYSSQGETTEAINYLEKFVTIARNNLQSLDMIRACTMLGDIYNEKVSSVPSVWKSLPRLKSVLCLYPPSHRSAWKMAETVGCSTGPGRGVELKRPLFSSSGLQSCLGYRHHQWQPLPFSN